MSYIFVSGTYLIQNDPTWNSVINNNVYLVCDTSAGAVNITLPEISPQFLTTKFYISDSSSNASVNNITINTSGTDTINETSSIVINTNGGSVICYVASGDSSLTLTPVISKWVCLKSNQAGGGGGGGFTTADNGLTANTATNVRLGGTLVQNTTITASTFNLALSGTSTFGGNAVLNSTTNSTGGAIRGVASSNGEGVIGNSQTGNGVRGNSVSSTGVKAESSSGFGLEASSSTGTAIYGSSTSSLPAQLIANPSATNTIVPIIQHRRQTSSTAQNDIGLSNEFYIETQSGGGPGGTVKAGDFFYQWSDSENTTRTARFGINLTNNAVEEDKLTIEGNGDTYLNDYGVGNKTGASTYLAGFNASGQFVEINQDGYIASSGYNYIVVQTVNTNNPATDQVTNGLNLINAITNVKLLNVGTKSVDNRIMVLLMPGTYLVDATIFIDVSFLDVVGISSEPRDTVIVQGPSLLPVFAFFDVDSAFKNLTLKSSGSRFITDSSTITANYLRWENLVLIGNIDSSWKRVVGDFRNIFLDSVTDPTTEWTANVLEIFGSYFQDIFATSLNSSLFNASSPNGIHECTFENIRINYAPNLITTDGIITNCFVNGVFPYDTGFTTIVGDFFYSSSSITSCEIRDVCNLFSDRAIYGGEIIGLTLKDSSFSNQTEILFVANGSNIKINDCRFNEITNCFTFGGTLLNVSMNNISINTLIGNFFYSVSDGLADFGSISNLTILDSISTSLIFDTGLLGAFNNYYFNVINISSDCQSLFNTIVSNTSIIRNLNAVVGLTGILEGSLVDSKLDSTSKGIDCVNVSNTSTASIFNCDLTIDATIPSIYPITGSGTPSISYTKTNAPIDPAITLLNPNFNIDTSSPAANGTFTSADVPALTITVVNGIVTSIV